MYEIAKNPGREFTLMPFWFWNDTLDQQEIIRQIEDFTTHGVYGFVIHPRVGLPRDTGFMSRKMLDFIRFAVEEAEKRQMKVILYDEGMYPSGSACGLVAAANPEHRCRCLAIADSAALPHKGNTVATVRRGNGSMITVIDRPVDSCIRGLHYIGDGPAEDEPAAGDVLNPAAVQSFISLSYQQMADAVKDHLGKTVLGFFTDEPGPLGRCRERSVMPGTTGIIPHINRLLGYDFTPHLPALWFDDEPDARFYRQEYARAISLRLEETYYAPIRQWCDNHAAMLFGHPGEAGNIGCERYFHVPGQDMVWRWILPHDINSLEGSESTQAKCSSSAMIHLRQRRNSNECFGAYGHEFNPQEMKNLTDWLLMRGVNMLIPHAFYYSIRGPRRDERPPDVGPNSAWWGNFKAYADYCARLCELNTDCQHICHTAILTPPDHLPWLAAKACFQHQIDFNYLEFRQLVHDSAVAKNGVAIAGMNYQALIIESGGNIPGDSIPALKILAKNNRLFFFNPEGKSIVAGLGNAIYCTTAAELDQAVKSRIPAEYEVTPHHHALRFRHVVKDGTNHLMMSNEGTETIRFKLKICGSPGNVKIINSMTMESSLPAPDGEIALTSNDLKIAVFHL